MQVGKELCESPYCVQKSGENAHGRLVAPSTARRHKAMNPVNHQPFSSLLFLDERPQSPPSKKKKKKMICKRVGPEAQNIFQDP